MPVHFDQAKKRWRFTFRRRIHGQRIQASKLLPSGWSRAQAEAYDRREGGRLYAEATGIAAPRLPLSRAVELWLIHKVPTLRNGKKAAQDLAHLAGYIEDAALSDLPDIAGQYRQDNPNLSDGTLHNRLAYLRSAVNYARKVHGYGRGQPDYSADMLIPIPDNQRQVYARLNELRLLWDAMPDPEARALFRVAFYCGLRWRAELLTRKPEHVIHNGEDVWLHIGVTKNGTPVMKPVHPDAREDLKFLPWSHGDSWFYERWRKAAKAIGRPELKPHDLRHSLASAIRSSDGGTLDDVRAALHHQSLQAADRYAHLYPETTKKILFAVGSDLHTDGGLSSGKKTRRKRVTR